MFEDAYEEMVRTNGVGMSEESIKVALDEVEDAMNRCDFVYAESLAEMVLFCVKTGKRTLGSMESLALAELGLVLARRGAVDKADETFRKAIDAARDEPDSYYDEALILAIMGEMYMRLGKLDKALVFVEDAFKMETAGGNVVALLLAMARLRLWRGDSPEEVLKYLDIAEKDEGATFVSQREAMAIREECRKRKEGRE